jgi:hypothetical protein
MVPLLRNFLGSAPAADAAGRFVVAAMARLTRVTQGKRFFTL